MLTAAAALACADSVAAQAFADKRPRFPGREGSGLAAAAADLNGDQLLDFVRVTRAGLDVLLQDVGGVMVRQNGITPLTLPQGASVIAVCTGTLGTSGCPDIVVGVTGGDSLLFVNDGVGNFTQQTPSPLPRPNGFNGATTQVLVADLDGTNGDDVIVLHDSAAPQIFVQQGAGGQGNGSFLERGSVLLPSGFFPQSPVGVVRDFTGDSLPDLIVVRRGIAQLPILLKNTGGGALTPQPAAFTGVPAWPATNARAGEVTGDGEVDLILTSTVAGDGIRILASSGTGTFSPVAIVSLAATEVRDVAVALVDGDTANDLVVLHEDGAVDLALDQGGVFSSATRLRTEGPRKTLILDDVENDGDNDLYVLGEDIEDSLLLGDGGGLFRSTEEVTIPSGRLSAPHAIALLDVSGEGDPDIVGYTEEGVPIALTHNGTARLGFASALPDLRPATILNVAAISASQPGVHDLAVLGTRPGGSIVEVLVLVPSGNGSLVDETDSRWPALSVSLTIFAVGDMVTSLPGMAGYDDVVAVDALGGLRMFCNQGGTFSEVANAFGGATVTGEVELLLGFIDGDANLDVVVLKQIGPPSVFLGQGGGQFQMVPQPILTSFPARQGIITDVTGDGNADILIVSRQLPDAVFLLAGQGDGTFVDQTASAPAPLPRQPNSVAALGGSSTQQPDAIIVTSCVAGDVMFRRQAGAFTLRTELPNRGSLATERVLVGDIDVDWDQDLVFQRMGYLPRVLMNQDLQLSFAMVQLGRQTTLHIRAPGDGSAALLMGINQARTPFWFGLFRIGPPLWAVGTLAVPSGGVLDLPFPTWDGWPEVEYVFQVAFTGSGTNLRMSNLEPWTLIAN